MSQNPHHTRCLRASKLNHGVRRHSSRNDTRTCHCECSMAQGVTLCEMTPEPVIARRPKADEAISTVDRGDCFVVRKRHSLLAVTRFVSLVAAPFAAKHRHARHARHESSRWSTGGGNLHLRPREPLSCR
jgi:hypothetical protein